MTASVTNSVCCWPIAEFGNEEQKQRFLPELAGGKCLGAFGLTEPDVGSDAQSVQTSYERSGGEYVINGRKKWTSFGGIADFYIVVAKCESETTAFIDSKVVAAYFALEQAACAHRHLAHGINVRVDLALNFNILAFQSATKGQLCPGTYQQILRIHRFLLELAVAMQFEATGG